jgi:guanosine-3',5'-bis(diphosphate) 3'-pyrophosphohydrolase
MADVLAIDELIQPEWEDPEALQRLLETVALHHHDAKPQLIRNAYYFAERAHEGQKRDSGEPYITHPLAVAQILADLQLDPETVVAGLLHDTLEDCAHFATPERLERFFGQTVLKLVEGVTKLRFPYRTEPDTFAAKKQEQIRRAAESLRKVLLAMAADLRVMVIKLADRMHNMRTIDALTQEKKERIANETMHVYAPLAARLGIWQLKWQLEDLAFRALDPEGFDQVAKALDKTRAVREQELTEAKVALKERLEKAGIESEIMGRPKHIYSIHNKLDKQKLSIDQIYDLLGLRVVTMTEADCYHALGIIHELWKPIPSMFYDYIAKPKPNLYQSLHTKVVGPNGEPLEVQIRTREMHELAEYGVAAHWAYKEGTDAPAARLPQLRQQLFDWSSDAKTSSEFLRNVSEDLFADQVFVFTPKGDVIDLPAGSTPIDFAYRIHTRLGETLVGAKVNARIVPINYELKNGDICEVQTRPSARPSLDWLQYIKTSQARNKIRGYLRKLNREENAIRGREALEKHIKSMGRDPREFLGEDHLNQIADKFKVANAEDLLAAVGEGLITANAVITRLRSLLPQEEQAKTPTIGRIAQEQQMRIAPDGIDSVMTKRARCCAPIPGDEVVGFVTRGRGMMIHRADCTNVLGMGDDDVQRLIPVDWEGDEGHVYGVTLQMDVMNRIGLLADVTHIFGEAKTNITAARIQTKSNQTAYIEIQLEVRDTKHLRDLMNRILNFGDVIAIRRVMGRKV